MGDWAIVIRGTGCHHNSDPKIDADHEAAEFVRRLKAQGHTIKSATFTSGGEHDVSDPEWYAKAWAKKPEPGGP